MKNKMFIAVGLLLGMFIAQNAYSAAISNSAAGGAVSITTGVTGAPGTITFNPSTNVWIGGLSASTAFQVNGYHEQALGKTAGQAYGMSSDSNKMFFLTIEGVSSDPRITTGTNSGALSSWTTM